MDPLYLLIAVSFFALSVVLVSVFEKIRRHK
jgi:hypothetical protein